MPAFFEEHDIPHRQYRVPDVTVPDDEVLTDAVAWIDAQPGRGPDGAHPLCQGSGRSATVLAAYLMEGDDVRRGGRPAASKRTLVKLQQHRRVLEAWIASGQEQR